jgi:hypothetical protein
MRKTLRSAPASVAVLSIVMFGNAAGAMTLDTSPVSVAASDKGLVQEAAIHCDWGGFFFAFDCWQYPGYYGYYRPHRSGWHHRHR